MGRFDDSWKMLVENHFEEFVHYYFLSVAKEIDWKKPYEFLDTELQEITTKSNTGRRTADKLVKVYMLDGRIEWVLVHLEIQCQKDIDIGRRMFTYYYRILDKFDKEVISLVLLADTIKNWRPDTYSTELCGTSQVFHFVSAKLLDFVSDLETAKQQRNPFAIATLAHIQAQKRGDANEKLEHKKYITRALLEAGYSLDYIRSLYHFVSRLMELPKDLEIVYNDYVSELDKENRKMYVSNYEKVIIEKAKRETAEEVTQQVTQQVTQKVTRKKNLETLKNLLVLGLGLDKIKFALALPDDEFDEMLQLAQKS